MRKGDKVTYCIIMLLTLMPWPCAFYFIYSRNLKEWEEVPWGKTPWRVEQVYPQVKKRWSWGKTSQGYSQRQLLIPQIHAAPNSYSCQLRKKSTPWFLGIRFRINRVWRMIDMIGVVIVSICKIFIYRMDVSLWRFVLFFRICFSFFR